MSVRPTAHVTGAAKNTITKFLVELGEACAKYQDETLGELPCPQFEADELGPSL